MWVFHLNLSEVIVLTNQWWQTMCHCSNVLYIGSLWNLSYTAKKGKNGQCSTDPTSKTFCWLGSKMKAKVSFHAGLMSLSMCLVLFLLSGAVGMNSSTYGSGVSTANTSQLQTRCSWGTFLKTTSFLAEAIDANGAWDINLHEDSQRSPRAPLVTLSARTTVTVNLWENCCSTCNATFIWVSSTPTRHVGKWCRLEWLWESGNR